MADGLASVSIMTNHKIVEINYCNDLPNHKNNKVNNESFCSAHKKLRFVPRSNHKSLEANTSLIFHQKIKSLKINHNLFYIATKI